MFVIFTNFVKIRTLNAYKKNCDRIFKLTLKQYIRSLIVLNVQAIWHNEYLVAGEGHRYFAQDWNIAFPHEQHILFFVTPLHSSITAKEIQSMQQLDHHSSTTIFHERNYLVLFILSITHGGYNIWIYSM